MLQTQVQNLVREKNVTKPQFFITFWTTVLAPFEYLILGLPFVSVIMIRLVAIGSNMTWYKYWFDSNLWQRFLRPNVDPMKEAELPLIVRILRMVSMKFLVNVTNLTLLFCITLAFASIYDTGLHFTLMGFVKKVGYVTLFAVILTPPYEWLLKYFGFENSNQSEVDLTSDI